MPRFYLFAEGQTEQTFATNVLRPHLANVGVYLQAAILIAHAKKKGRIHQLRDIIIDKRYLEHEEKVFQAFMKDLIPEIEARKLL